MQSSKNQKKKQVKAALQTSPFDNHTQQVCHLKPKEKKTQFFRQPGKPPCTCPSHIEALAELHYTNPEMPKVVTKEQSQHHPGKGGLPASG